MRPTKRHLKKTSGILDNPPVRYGFVLMGFGLIFSLIIVKLFFLQIIDHEKYEALAEMQYTDYETIPARRGTIYSSDGFVLAGSKTNYLVFAEPKKVTDAYKAAHGLATITSTPETFTEIYNKYLAQLTADLFWTPLEKNISEETKKKIDDLKIIGIGFEEVPARYYPEGTLASHVLGFVGSTDTGEKVGYYGIEGALNEELKGRPGKIVEERDATGAPILSGGYKKIEPSQGRDITLTIDRSVQYSVEKKIKAGVEKYDAVSGCVIVMNPMSGEIVAMANYPTFDPENFNEPEEPLKDNPRRLAVEKRNRCISVIYEPGSVIKPLTVSAGIDLGLVSGSTTYQDDGPVRYSDYYINNWDGKHYGTMTVVQLLQKSNNIGAAWVGHRVGPDNLYTYFTNFGLGSRTQVELEGEDTGVIHSADGWTDIDTATASFGQGISATPLQVVSAFNVIANGGTLISPKIINKINDNDHEFELESRSLKRVISESTSDQMIDMLEKAAAGGEAKYFVLKEYRIAGKTGTAQIPEKGKYSATRTNATFVGFLVGSKKFTMIVKLEEPKTSPYAAETAVPLWMDIATELVKYYGIPSDRVVEEPAVVSQPAVVVQPAAVKPQP